MIPISKLIEEGQGKLADQLKLYVFKTDSDLFKLIDFNNDECFLEPLLFAHFFAAKFSKNRSFDLLQILIGYVNPAKWPKILDVVSDDNGTVYLPKIGYFKTGYGNESFLLKLKNGSIEEIYLKKTDEKIDFTFSHNRLINGTNIEICQSIHPLISDQFHESIDQKTGKGQPIKSTIADFIYIRETNIQEAAAIIKNYFPELHDQIDAVGRRLLVFENPKIISFATRVSHGTSYLSANINDSVLFYVSEIIHQFSHNILYSVMVDLKKYFIIDPFKPLATYSNYLNEERTIFSAFHGLFTTSQLACCLEVLYDQRAFEGLLHFELIGRLVDNFRRFRTGLQELELSKVLTEDGIMLYNYFDQKCEEVYHRKKDLLVKYDVSDQPFVFNVSLFFNKNEKIKH